MARISFTPNGVYGSEAYIKQIIAANSGNNFVFCEQFTGNGVATTFQLTGALIEDSYVTGTWSAANILPSKSKYATTLAGDKLYNSTNWFTRTQITPTGISAGGLVTLSNPPLNGAGFYIYYFYKLPSTDSIDYYDDKMSSYMLSTDPDIAANIHQDQTTNGFGTTVQAALDAIYTALGGKQASLTSTVFGSFLTGLTGKTTPVDADETTIADSADSNKAKKLTLTNLWANYLKAKADALYQAILTSTNFGTFISGLTAKTTPVGADGFAIADSEDSNKAKFFTFTNLTTYLSTLYASITLAGLSVLGRSTNSTGSVAAITGSVKGSVVRVAHSGTALEFGGGWNMMVAMISASSNSGTTNYFALNSTLSGVLLASKTSRAIALSAGYAKTLRVRTNTSQPASGSQVFGLHLNSTTTALVVTIAAGSAAGTFINTSDTVTIADNDLGYWEQVNNATATSATVIGVSWLYSQA